MTNTYSLYSNTYSLYSNCTYSLYLINRECSQINIEFILRCEHAPPVMFRIAAKHVLEMKNQKLYIDYFHYILICIILIHSHIYSAIEKCTAFGTMLSYHQNAH